MATKQYRRPITPSSKVPITPSSNAGSALLTHRKKYSSRADTMTHQPTSLLSGLLYMKTILGSNFKYAIFVLIVLTVCNIFVQIDIFLIGVSSKEMQIDQNWGNKKGTGTEYDILAGPLFTLAHILAILPAGYLVDTGCISHEVLLFFGILMWSASVVLTGWSNKYWEVALYRCILAIFTSFAGTLCISIISKFFPSEIHSSACALWNLAIYIGFSVAYGAGNAIGEYYGSWRYMWWIFGYAGIAWSFFILLLRSFKKHTLNYISLNMDDKQDADKSCQSDIDINSQTDLTDEFADGISYSKTEYGKKKNKIRMLTTVRSIGASTSAYDNTNTRYNTGTTEIWSRLDTSVMYHHQQIVSQMEQQPVTISKVFLYLAKSPSLVLLLFASFYRNCGGYIWVYQADNFFQIVTGDNNYEVATWLSWVPMVAGSIGCLLGGIISDKLAKHHDDNYRITPTMIHIAIGKTIIKRIWILVISNLLSFPFAAGVVILDSPYCYMSLFGMYIFSEMWISVSITLLIDFSPLNMRTTMLSIYYFSMGLSGFAPLLVTFVETWMNSYKWAIFVLFPCVYGSSSILFFLVIFTYHRDLRKKIDTLY